MAILKERETKPIEQTSPIVSPRPQAPLKFTTALTSQTAIITLKIELSYPSLFLNTYKNKVINNSNILIMIKKNKESSVLMLSDNK